MTEKPNPVHDIESEGGVIAHSPGAVRNRADGASLIQVNTLSNPVLVVLVTALVLIAALAGTGVGLSIHASYAAQMSEREARLAQRHAERLDVRLQVMEQGDNNVER